MTARSMHEAIAARDRALDQVAKAADARWKEHALQCVRRTCEQLPDFISDDIWTTGGLDSTREDRALGPIMLQAARRGWAVKTDRVRPSVRSHGSGKPVWKSLIHDPGFGDGRLFSTPPVAPGNALTEEAA